MFGCSVRFIPNWNDFKLAEGTDLAYKIIDHAIPPNTYPLFYGSHYERYKLEFNLSLRRNLPVQASISTFWYI